MKLKLDQLGLYDKDIWLRAVVAYISISAILGGLFKFLCTFLCHTTE